MDVAQWVAAAAFSAYTAATITLVRLAINAERRRADDWRLAAQAGAEANASMSANVDRLVVTVEQLSSSQREALLLLQRIDHDRRSTA